MGFVLRKMFLNHFITTLKTSDMTQEEKELLLKDLCARLPYNFVYCYCNAPIAEGKSIVLTPVVISNLMNATDDLVIKPYLRPMSSMTIDEEKEYFSFYFFEKNCFNNTIGAYKLLDWLNAHHFDYRGLIEKGLALEAPKDMHK